MAQKLTCPACGADLEYSSGEPIVRCTYCGSTITVPEALRPQQQPAWTAAPPSGTPLTVDLGGLLGMAGRLREVRQLARDGQLAEAAQLYREVTGARAEEAEQVVQQLAAGQSIVVSSTTTSTSIPVTPDTPVQVVTGPQAVEVLTPQLGAAQQLARPASRALLWAVVGAAVLLLGIAVLAFLMMRAPIGP